MKNTLTSRCIYWSALQVFIFVVCCRGKVSSAEIAQGCVGSEISLECPEMKVINVTAVVLGDSECYWSCCIKDNDCTHNANENHRTEVHIKCDDKRRCNVKVIKEKIPCWYGNAWSNNDFERITYNCRDDPRRLTEPNTATPSRPRTTEDGLHAIEKTAEDEAANDGTTSDNGDIKPHDKENGEQTEEAVGPAVMATICFLVLVAIIVVVVIIRRKRRTHVKHTVEMTDIDNNDRNEAIYANENQITSLSHRNGSLSPDYSNDATPKAKKSYRGAEVSDVPNNGVYSLAGGADSTSTEGSNVYSKVDNKEPEYQVPSGRSDVYSIVRNVEDPGRTGSTADASSDDGNLYCDVETREPVKAANSAAVDVYDEACNWNESEYKDVTAGETNPAQKKASPAQTGEPVSYSKVNKPSKSAATFDLRADSPVKVEAKGEVNTNDGFPSPTYETMSPGIPESIYANEPAMSPTRSLAASTISREGSETENPYCEMQSPPVRFKDDGAQTLIENDLYSH